MKLKYSLIIALLLGIVLFLVDFNVNQVKVLHSSIRPYNIVGIIVIALLLLVMMFTKRKEKND